MPLPADLETAIADYLAREFGEHGPGRISAADLRALGERVIDGGPMRVWAFPTSRGDLWATVEPMGDSYCIGMTHPRASSDGHQRYHLRLETEGDEGPRTLALEPLDIGLYGTASDVGFVAPDGRTRLLSAEVGLVDGGAELSLAILAKDEVVLGVRARLPCVIAWSGCLIEVACGD
jgi:hypothetical protein